MIPTQTDGYRHDREPSERTFRITNRRPMGEVALAGLIGCEVIGVTTWRSDPNDPRYGSPALRLRCPDGEVVLTVLAFIDGALDVSHVAS